MTRRLRVIHLNHFLTFLFVKFIDRPGRDLLPDYILGIPWELPDILSSYGLDFFHPLRSRNRKNPDVQWLAQEAGGAEQNAESLGPHIVVEVPAAFPFRNHVEYVIVLDIGEDAEAQASPLLLRALDQ